MVVAAEAAVVAAAMAAGLVVAAVAGLVAAAVAAVAAMAAVAAVAAGGVAEDLGKTPNPRLGYHPWFPDWYISTLSIAPNIHH